MRRIAVYDDRRANKQPGSVAARHGICLSVLFSNDHKLFVSFFSTAPECKRPTRLLCTDPAGLTFSVRGGWGNKDCEKRSGLMRKEADQHVAPQRNRKKEGSRRRDRDEVMRAGINKCKGGELMKISW